MQWFKRFGWIILSLFLVSACSSGTVEEETGEEPETEEKVEEVTPATGTLGQTIIATNGVAYTLSYTSQETLTPAYLPDKDFVFLYCLVNIQNDTSQDIDYDVLDWKIETAGKSEYTPSDAAMAGVEGLLESGTLSPGEGVEGIIAFEVPVEGSLTLIRYDMTTGRTLASWNIIR